MSVEDSRQRFGKLAKLPCKADREGREQPQSMPQSIPPRPNRNLEARSPIHPESARQREDQEFPDLTIRNDARCVNGTGRPDGPKPNPDQKAIGAKCQIERGAKQERERARYDQLQSARPTMN